MMIKRRNKTILLIIIVLFAFLIIVQDVFNIGTMNEEQMNFIQTTEEQILNHLDELAPHYYWKSSSLDNFQDILNNINEGTESAPSFDWQYANKIFNKNGIFKYNQHLKHIIFKMKNFNIMSADLDKRGTQLKFLFTLKGEQKVIFKPKWYNIDHIVNGPVYAGKDRFQSEILAFYLAVILRRPLVPVATYRKIDVEHLLKVGSKQLLSTSFKRGNSTCIYGKCFYCKREDPICDIHGSIDGTVIFNINATIKTHRSPWQRTYSSGRKAVWQIKEDYCGLLTNKMDKKRLYELVETSIFDFLIQNGDRHHYETINNKIVWMDNGKGLGNPNIYHIDILAPLYQCCLIHKEFLDLLKALSGGLFTELLKKFKDLHMFLTEKQFKALDDRLLIVFATIEFCKKKNKIVKV